MTTDDIEILDIEFLTPAKLTVKRGNFTGTEMVSVDIVNRKVYDQHGNTELSDYVFSHLDSANSVPEDFFAAPSDMTEEAVEMMDCAKDSYLNSMSQGELNE